MDLPTIDGINTYFVAEHTRSAGVKVALSGLGGDEIFAGYSSFRHVPRMERFADAWDEIPEFARRPLGKCLRSSGPKHGPQQEINCPRRQSRGFDPSLYALAIAL